MIENNIMKKKSISILLFFFTLIMVFSFRIDGVHASTNGRTQAQAVAWANAHVGGPALDIDPWSGLGAQCVDFTCYYYQELGQAIPWGNACDYVNGGAFCPAGWSYQSSPAPGDIAVWSGYYPGHVAIVTEIRGSQMICVEQNYAGISSPTANKHNIDATTYIRPDFAGSAPPQETVNRVHPDGSVNVPDGNYIIVSKLNTGMCLDVRDGGKANGTDLLLCGRHDRLNQQFRFIKQPGGKTFRMQSVCNDLFIDNGGSPDNGFKSHMWEWASSGAQMWHIVDDGNGWFSFVNEYSGLALDVRDGSTAHATTIQQCSFNHSDAQKFRLYPVGSENITDGTYTIVSKLNMGKCFDVSGGGTTSGTPLILHDRHGGTNQQFQFLKQQDGRHRIKAVCNDLFIDNGGSLDSGFKTHMWGWFSTVGQEWHVVDNGDGWYSFVNEYSGLTLDLPNANTSNGTRLQQLSANGTDAQKFRLFPVGSADIPDGTYTIESKLDSNKVLDVNGGGTTNGTNLLLYERHNGANQQFRIIKQPDGKTYRMQSVCNNLFIDDGNTLDKGANTHMWEWASTGAQMWYIVDRGDGYYSIINHDSGLNLDVENGNTANGTNIRQWNDNTSNAQRFRFIPVETTPAPAETGGGDNQQEEQPVQPEQPEQPEQPIDTGLPQINYRTHVQNVGWQPYVANGAMAGTSGRSLRLEGMNINLQNQNYTGDIEYRTHIQNIGWENGWKKNDDMSGTSGRSLRLEAMQVRLTGEMAEHYDVYYRVHAQNIGWMGWAKNGEEAGTAGHAYRLEAMQIVLVDKGGAAPNLAPACNDYRAFVQK